VVVLCHYRFIHSHFKKKLEFQQSTRLAAIYYNGGKSNIFRVHVDATLADLKHQLTQLNSRLHFCNERRVTDLEYYCHSVCSDETVLFTNMKLQNDGDVRTVFSIVSQHMTKGSIELDVKLVRFVQVICLNLIHPGTFDKIATCMVEHSNLVMTKLDQLIYMIIRFVCLC
jgi:hypothetical protein